MKCSTLSSQSYGVGSRDYILCPIRERGIQHRHMTHILFAVNATSLPHEQRTYRHPRLRVSVLDSKYWPTFGCGVPVVNLIIQYALVPKPCPSLRAYPSERYVSFFSRQSCSISQMYLFYMAVRRLLPPYTKQNCLSRDNSTTGCSSNFHDDHPLYMTWQTECHSTTKFDHVFDTRGYCYQLPSKGFENGRYTRGPHCEKCISFKTAMSKILRLCVLPILP